MAESRSACRRISSARGSLSGSGQAFRRGADSAASIDSIPAGKMVQEDDREQHRGAVRWNRDLGSAIQEAQRKVAEQVPLPAGSRMEWVGELGNLQDAIARL